MSNYVEMWKELGMDLETHDALCQVLPTAFGDMYLSQENRPEGMGFWDFVVSEIHGIRPSELIEAQKNGQKVFGTFCVYVPDEVVLAANGIVTGLCGGSQFWVPGGEKVLPKSTCPLIKASVGARLERTCPFFRIADMYVGETTCDGKKKAWEILGQDVPMHIMDMPQMKRPQDIEKWADEIKIFAKVVEDFTGNAITPEKLSEGIHVINERRKALKRVYDARKSKNIPISGKDALLMMQIAFFDDPVRCAEMANKLADELEQRNKDNVSVFPAGTKRILVTGTPMAIPNWKLHHLIETSGAAVVCEETCTGTRYFENLVDETKTTLEEQYAAIADRYMGINCACFTPNSGRVDDILRLAKEYDVDGVIDVNLKFCCLYDTEGYTVEKAMKDAGIPVLGIETDYTDEDAEQLRTRIEAFVEMLG
ncbi:double-cubane-cluster-containing anaerobic reductase [Hespellia stercorisuis]|uniref:Benzoyl-CoA reductase/2-hydroxyglutaryl-CoA dehydratase subunit, BcrC/BadD/HgdB n=1 Tax=Hespellia stercorisuis DSM 15480 TaxID=1121950 RepID=A0A1M6RT41_9FIRM|nr:double-cubane-cluster-containing anaerobic reductase [Hespellia stercorisuis]SHK35518.1 Benzoyl-CoA reductase/2-hydroxyglutaryl-CoA dehydratase subunit, BcrC/BadD/HgdB [Hespellia stercorisuis DSM 15480]